MLQTSTFNSRITEIEGKITAADNKIPDISGLATKIKLTAVDDKIPEISGLASKTTLANKNAFVKKTDYATEISGIKNNYVTNAAFTSQLNDLKSQHIADEVKKVDDQISKSSTDILGFESRLKKKEDALNELEIEGTIILINGHS